MGRRLPLLTLTLVAIVLSGGCGSKKVSTNLPPTKQPTGETPTDAECEKFAADFTAALTAGDPIKANRMIDWDMLLDIVTSGIDVPPSAREGFIAGAKRSTSNSVAGNIIRVIKEGGSYDFLRVRESGSFKAALLRMITPEGGLNYHEVILVKNDGVVRAADIYVYGSAEMFSRTLRRLYLIGVARSQPTLLERLSGSAKQEAQHGTDVIKIGGLVAQQQYQQAVQVYRGLPQDLRREKPVMLMYVLAASKLDDATYETAIDEFRKAHAGDPCVDMLSIDGFILKKDYDRALEATTFPYTCVKSLPKKFVNIYPVCT